MRALPLDLGLIHFVGIGGIGMSGIAEVLHNLGYKVQGSDVAESANTRRIAELGMKVMIGHRAENVGNAQVMVVSSAVKKDNPEVLAARTRHVPVVRRAEMLGELMRLKWSIAVGGTHGKMMPETLAAAMGRVVQGDVHSVQRGMLSITNVTETGTVYSPAEVAALAALAKSRGMHCHLDGARFANALVATGATAAAMTWKAGIDVVSFGGTKNGCLGVEAVVIFDPAKAWEFELRRKRGGHLFSKHRMLSAQMEAYLTDGLWLRLAGQANAMGSALARGLAGVAGAKLMHPAQANMIFAEWDPGTHARAEAKGAVFYPWPAAQGREAARLVASWSTTEADVDGLIASLRG